jgi:restriction system protein
MLVIGILIGLAGLSGVIVGRRLIIGSILMIIGYALSHTAINEMHGSFMQDAAQVVPLALIILIVASIVSWYKRGSARIRSGGSVLGRLGGGYDFWSLSPSQFEELVAEMLRHQGYTDVRVNGGAGDLGADVIAQLPGGEGLAIAQCKRYAPDRKVGSPEMQQFIGMAVTHHQAQQAIYVSTGGFTEPAIQLGRQHGVELVDAARLQQLLAPRLGAA